MQEQQLAQHIPTEQEKINSELVKFDKYQARLEELREQYSGLKIKDIDDKEGYEAVKDAVATLRTMRGDTEQDRKDTKAFYLRAGKEIDKKAEFINTGILSIETPLKKRKEEIDEEKEAEKKRKQEEENNRYTQRTADLTKMGVLFSDGDFILDDISYEAALIKGAPDEVYNEIFAAFKEKFDANELKRLEEEAEQKRKDEELAELRKQKEEFEAFKKQQADTLFQTRALQLPETVIIENKIYDKEDHTELFSRELLLEYDQVSFDAYVKYRQDLMEERRIKKEAEQLEEDRKKQAAIDLFNNRLAMLPDAVIGTGNKEGLVFNSKYTDIAIDVVYIKTEDEDSFKLSVVTWKENITARIEAEKKAEAKRLQDIEDAKNAAATAALKKKQAEDAAAEEKRKEELAASSDKVKWDDLLNQLNAIQWPEMKSNAYKGKLNRAKELVNSIK